MSFLDENKIPLSMLKINYLSSGAKFSGSFKGKRYIFEPVFETLENNKNVKKEILLHVYPDKFCFEKTDKNNIDTTSYTFDEKGINDGINYLEGIFDK